jgi:hypothetical protein
MMEQLFEHKTQMLKSKFINNIKHKNDDFINEVTQLDIDEKFKMIDVYFEKQRKNIDITYRKLKMESKLKNKSDYELEEQISLWKSTINTLIEK